MSITQTVEIPANRRLVIDVPREIPTKSVILTFTPAKEEQKKIPVFGYAKGKYNITDAFFEPLDDFKDYM